MNIFPDDGCFLFCIFYYCLYIEKQVFLRFAYLGKYSKNYLKNYFINI